MSAENKEYRALTPEEQHVILNKGTERPFTGHLLNEDRVGIYTHANNVMRLYIDQRISLTLPVVGLHLMMRLRMQ